MAKPHLSAAYVSLALKLQESVEDLNAADAQAKLVTALMNMSLTEVGKRNSSADQQILQTIHDHAVSLGAGCTMGESAMESAVPEQTELKLTEAASTEPIELREASKSDYEIKLIAPGKGAMAYYPADVLQRDGPRAFPSETKVYLNHPTKEQEAEGAGNRDVHRLAGVLTKPAEWIESHPKGPGLYSRVKVFADHAQLMEEKSPYLAMSIMANGRAAVEAGGKRILKEGVPLLASLDVGESVDVVPKAGAGGMILQEAAQPQEGVSMTQEEAQALIESAVSPFRKRAIKGDAREEVEKLLSNAVLSPLTKQKIIEAALKQIPEKDGALDAELFRESVVALVGIAAEATGLGQVRGFGPSAAVAAPVKEAEQPKPTMDDDIAIWESLGLPKEAAKFAATGRTQ